MYSYQLVVRGGGGLAGRVKLLGFGFLRVAVLKALLFSMVQSCFNILIQLGESTGFVGGMFEHAKPNLMQQPTFMVVVLNINL